MDSFLSQVARGLYDKYGDELSSLNIIFPSRRARLFFADALSRIIDKPLWQPHYTSVDDVMTEIAGVRPGDRIRLIAELYKAYSNYHTEPFDSFYFWGEVLLSDFDSIDKYRLDADMLFANISDLKQLEHDLGYLTNEQREVIARFWRSFGTQVSFSVEQQRFMDIWTTLAPIYHDFRNRLAEQGLAYTGMIYRGVADSIKAGSVPESAPKRYVIAGFNALSECEKILFDFLAKRGEVEFFWDYDVYYLRDQEQEAGLFLRENVTRFPQNIPLPYDYDSFRKPKEITVVAAPSDSLQCKYIADFLRQVEDRTGRVPDKDTAIVLTDENLLLPALHSIPDEIDKINVTMGYPLKQTLAYTFVERLINLQAHRQVRDGRVLYYHEDVRGLLEHPFILEYSLAEATRLSAMVADRQQVYVEITSPDATISELFTPVDDEWRGVSAHLLRVISMAVGPPPQDDLRQADYKQRIEYFSLIAENIEKLQNTLDGCAIELSTKVFASLLRRVLQSIRVPYEGEPLQGVQVMGILETRNLDFDNVILLSANDDSFPGNRTSSPSFIPGNLRLAYGLPTPQHHEGVYAYYFYRLLQRASDIHIVYSARSDDKSSGEQSRYIYQLEYESPHDIVRREMALNVSVAPYEPIEIEKSAEVITKLMEFCDPAGRRLSPTSFYNYIQCPLKFYFHSVARLSGDDEISEQIDTPLFGTILHKAMELLYHPLTGRAAPQSEIRRMIGTPAVDAAVDAAIQREYFKDEKVQTADYAGNLLLARDIVVKYINTCVLPFDAGQMGVVVRELEKHITSEFPIRSGNSSLSVFWGGYSDRVDMLPDGTLRIVDYKTGAKNLEFKGIQQLFSQSPADNNAAVLQTMLYAMMFNHRTCSDVQPALYYVRFMNNPDYSPLVVDKDAGCAVSSYIAYKSEFETELREKLSEMFNPSIPFTQCADPKPCQWCDFNVICKRTSV